MGQDRPLEIAEPLSFRHGRRSCAAYPPQTQDRAAARFIPGNIPAAEKPPDFPLPWASPAGCNRARRSTAAPQASSRFRVWKFQLAKIFGNKPHRRPVFGSSPPMENDNDQAVNS
jgi:hypothetical protein